MAASDRETEAKFYVQDLDAIQKRLVKCGARLIQERVLETNIRFDLPRGRLRREGRVLRLRKDTAARLTYKSASKRNQGVLSREEIELIVEDFEKAKRFLEALGYDKLFYYEKYRTTYELNTTLVMLDELPYGIFVEIEGETIEAIRQVAEALLLKFEMAVLTSYHGLFDRLRKRRKLPTRDLSFADFAGVKIRAEDLEVRAADDSFYSAS